MESVFDVLPRMVRTAMLSLAGRRISATARARMAAAARKRWQKYRADKARQAKQARA